MDKDINEKQKKQSSFFKDFGSVVITVVVMIFVMTNIVVNAKVPSGSMENTIMTGDRLFGLRFLHNYKKGDIIIFKNEENGGVYLIKRIIGMPGETVEIKKGENDTAEVYINGNRLDEDYLPEPMLFTEGLTLTLPDDGYFVMGDNRNHSYDARFWNEKIVYENDIIGIAKLRYWPLTKIGLIK